MSPTDDIADNPDALAGFGGCNAIVILLPGTIALRNDGSS
jgi:hypothetical protein